MNSLVSFNLCTLSDKELLKRVDAMTDEMFERGEIPSRHIPAHPNNDYDLLVGELVKRFDNMLNNNFQIERTERYWFYCGRNCKEFYEITFWYNPITCERKETRRSESFFPSEEYKMPDWCKCITEHRKHLDAQYY